MSLVTSHASLLEQIVDELERLTERPLRQQHTCFETYIFAPSLFQNRHFACEPSSLFLLHEENEVSRHDKDCSILISLISFPGEDRTVSVNLCALKLPLLNFREGGNKKEIKTKDLSEKAVSIVHRKSCSLR
ncbi:hypothetical protein HJG54_32990 [Leptolyngbya sp. NK1-12]|uniref:Uncharacterized protein n=1 Tax=Leptolyngbya sp. NK1-12 TaxID=2547451 RepID=A0AA96WQT4_9CYAN|nr:hypothetical protein [Leptolyngbya sp. NK1-12]WNZ27666.1 hypothetical protein HJG54_32990 [Leptolyngbya sp. NK1-12]